VPKSIIDQYFLERSPQTVTPNGYTKWSPQAVITKEGNQNPSKIDRKNNIYLSKKNENGYPTSAPVQKLLALKNEDIIFFWPNLSKAEFSTHQIEQIVGRLSQTDKLPDRIFQSLDFAEWELENGKMTDKSGQPVNDPNSFVFNSLARNGCYRRPAGYISPEEQAEIDEKKESARIAKLRKETKQHKTDNEFSVWKEGLSKDDLEKILKNQKGPTDQWLKFYWEKNICN
jgi:hypothetical protein